MISVLLSSKELCQGVNRSFDIGAGEHAEDHCDSIGASIDHLLGIVDCNATDGEYRDVNALLDFLCCHRPRNVSVTRGADDRVRTKAGMDLANRWTLATNMRPLGTVRLGA